MLKDFCFHSIQTTYQKLRYGAGLVFVVLTGACGSASSGDPDVSVTRKPIPATAISVIKAEIRPFEYFILTSGTISSATEVRTQFSRSGILEKVFVQNGQRVIRGQVIAILTNKAQQLSLTKSEVSLHERRLAFEDQMMSYKQFDSVKYEAIGKNVRISSGLAASEVTYEEAKYEFENSFVRALTDGIVSGVDLHPGSPVSSGDLFCHIHDPSSLLVQTEVLETDAMILAIGTAADIMPLAANGEVYLGKISNINPRVDIKTGLVKVVLQLEGTSKAFPGMHVNVRMRLPFKSNIIVLKEAIVIRSGKQVVFTAVNGKAYWNYVKTGRENGKEIEVLEGLKTGDNVIISNNLQLAHDAPVTVTP